MARLEFFVVSESCAIDAQTNRLSVFNVLESVTAPAFPTLLASLAIVAVWNAEPGDETRDFQASALIHTEPAQRFDINFKLEKPRARTIVQLQGLPIQAAGTVRFEMLLNGEHKADHIVTAEIVPLVASPVH